MDSTLQHSEPLSSVSKPESPESVYQLKKRRRGSKKNFARPRACRNRKRSIRENFARFCRFRDEACRKIGRRKFQGPHGLHLSVREKRERNLAQGAPQGQVETKRSPKDSGAPLGYCLDILYPACDRLTISSYYKMICVFAAPLHPLWPFEGNGLPLSCVQKPTKQQQDLLAGPRHRLGKRKRCSSTFSKVQGCSRLFVGRCSHG